MVGRGPGFHVTAEPANTVMWMPRSRPILLPYPPLGALFKGRAEVLVRIHDAVRHGARFGGRIAAQAIEGIGGIGKTRAAVEYAWAHQDDYTALLLVNAESPEALTQNLSGLTTLLGLGHLDNQPDVGRRNEVVKWLDANPGWLLILDNVDTDAASQAVVVLLSALSGGHVLLTTRLHGIAAGVEAISLDVLDTAAAMSLLLERTDGSRVTAQDDALEAATLADALGGLPLALEMAASTIRAKQCSFADYHRMLRENRDQVTGRNEPAIAGYGNDLAASLLHSTDTLSEAAQSPS